MINPMHGSSVGNPLIRRALFGIPLIGGAPLHRLDVVRRVELLPLRLYRGYCVCGFETRRTLTDEKARKLVFRHFAPFGGAA